MTFRKVSPILDFEVSPCLSCKNRLEVFFLFAEMPLVMSEGGGLGAVGGQNGRFL